MKCARRGPALAGVGVRRGPESSQRHVVSTLGGGAPSVIREISRINERELTANVSSAASWHAQYKDSAYVYVGGLPYELNEGDIIVVFSQYGTVAGGLRRRRGRG